MSRTPVSYVPGLYPRGRHNIQVGADTPAGCAITALRRAAHLKPLASSFEPVMKARRKFIAYIATSADGYIARPDGDVEWLNRRPRTVDYGMREFCPTIDTILWGRKTYDWLLNYYKKKGKKAGLFDTKVTNYVFSRKPRRRSAPGVEFVSEPVKPFAQRLRATPGKQIWMMGGGELLGTWQSHRSEHLLPTSALVGGTVCRNHI